MYSVDMTKEAQSQINEENLANAEAKCVRDLEENGQSVDVLYLLAQILARQGRSRGAVSCMEAIVSIQSQNGLFRAHLAEALRATGDSKQAVEVARQAVELASEEQDVHNCLGLALMAEQQYAEAIEAFSEATRLSPETSVYWNNLGTARRENRSFSEAIDALKTACQLEPDNPDFLSNLANALVEDGRHHEAVERFEELLQIECNAENFSMLGQVYDELGQGKEAEECYRAAQTIDPAIVSPIVNLAFYHKARVTDQDLASLEQQLDEPSLTEPQIATVRFALAHLLDNRGRYHEAAIEIRKANVTQKQWNDSQNSGYRPEPHRETVRRIIEVFNVGFFASRSSWGNNSQKPVFVVGLPRSGTTLTRQILAAHPEVHAVGELKLGSTYFESLPHRLERQQSPPDCVELLTDIQTFEIADQYLADLCRLNSVATRLVDKMTDNYLLIGWLALLFPNARFIRCVRDPRDIALSCLITAFANVKWKNDDNHLIDRFDQYRRLIDHWSRVFSEKIHDVVYEETVVDPESQARRLIEWIGLPWHDACLDHSQAGGVIITASLSQARQPMYQSSVGRWKNYQPYLGELFDRIRHIEPSYS